MKKKKQQEPAIEKPRMHPRNKNLGRYDLTHLIEVLPELKPFVKPNIHGNESVDFANPDAVKTLNKALLKSQYGIDNWNIPEGYLCPPIPGRADYIHHIADLLKHNNYGEMPTGEKIIGLDVGVGSSCIYPIIGNKEYGWSFIASDIDPVSVESADDIVETNPSLKGKIELRMQNDINDYFYGIIQKDEVIDFTVCNPPFHASAEEAKKGTFRKLKHIKKDKEDKEKGISLNFGGKSNELVYDGGERRFIGNMIRQSKKFSTSCFWFSTLVSKQSNLKNIYSVLKEVKATEIETIAMGQGNKSSRIVAWSFLTKKEQKEWKIKRWKAV